MTQFTAIVPIKESSSRIERKNFRQFLGAPLFQKILLTLLEAEEVQEVVVSTDSDWLINHLSETSPKISTIKRPAELALSSTPMNAVIEHVLEAVSADWFIQTHATSPLISAATIDAGVRRFQSVWPDYDSLFSVTRKQERLWSTFGMPINHDPRVLLPTQDLEPMFVENSAFYLFHRKSFYLESNRIGQKPYLFETPELESVDIDSSPDFEMAEALGTYFEAQADLKKKSE